MVGVAGKSKGCNTCRKRKIACDQQKPACAKCIRSNRICGGYEKERVFVLVQPDAEKTHTFLRRHSRSMSPQKTINSRELVSNIPSTATVVGANESHRFFTETSFPDKIMHQQIERNHLIQAFLLNCFPFHWRPASQAWVFLLAELPTQVEVFEMSSAAVAASALGHMFNSDALVKQGLKYYTRGLHQLQKALHDPRLIREDEILAACMALSLYEALECPNMGSEGYFNHCHGLIALIQFRGQDVHSSGAGHLLYRGVRVPGILFALKNHTSNVFSNPTWMEQPRIGILKTPHDWVTDCLSQAPVILQQVRSLPHLNTSQQVDLLRELIRECWQTDQKLDVAYDEMRRQASDVLYWHVSSQAIVDPRQSEPLFPVVFCFQNAQVAATLLLLWATRTMVWSGLSNMYQYLEGIIATESPSSMVLPFDLYQVSGGMGTSSSLDRCGEYLSIAHRVCQSVEYFLKDELLLAGPLAVSPALGIVSDSLRNRPGHDREIAWLQTALEAVRRKGLRVLQHVDI